MDLATGTEFASNGNSDASYVGSHHCQGPPASQNKKRPLSGEAVLFFAIALSTYSSSASKWKKTPFCS